MTETGMKQYAPKPVDLYALVASLKYMTEWTFRLRDKERDPADTHGHSAGGLTLSIVIETHNTYPPNQAMTVEHLFIVPAATYNMGAWQRWLLDCILKVHQHEACEEFILQENGVEHRPFAPLHGPGDDPYVIVQYATDTQRRTSFRGELNPE